MSRKGGKIYVFVLLVLGILLALAVGTFSPSVQQSKDEIEAKTKENLQEKAAGRIICASPAVSEIVAALGLAENICGISDYADYPPEILDKPRIGGAFNPNLERIVQLAPDLMIGQGKMDTIADLCKNNGISYFSVKLDSLDDIYAAFRKIGEKTEGKLKGSQLAANLRDCLDSVSTKAGKLSRRKVFLVCGRLPGKLAGFMTVGKGTFLNDILEIAGGENIFADAKGLYPQISREAAATRKPDVIIELVALGKGEDKAEKFAKARADWENMADTVGLGGVRVEVVDGSVFLKPGPRIAVASKMLFEIIHQGD